MPIRADTGRSTSDVVVVIVAAVTTPSFIIVAKTFLFIICGRGKEANARRENEEIQTCAEIAWRKQDFDFLDSQNDQLKEPLSQDHKGVILWHH
jgi:hypothetical protein